MGRLGSVPPQVTCSPARDSPGWGSGQPGLSIHAGQLSTACCSPCPDGHSERGRGLPKVTQPADVRVRTGTQACCLSAQPRPSAETGPQGGGLPPHPSTPTFTFPVLGILLKRTIPRQRRDVWLSFPGTRLSFSVSAQSPSAGDLPPPPPPPAMHGGGGLLVGEGPEESADCALTTWFGGSSQHPLCVACPAAPGGR